MLATTADTLRRYSLYLIDKLKNLFKGGPSKEAMEMWDTLKKMDEYDPREDPSLAINVQYYMSIPTQKGRDKYITDLMRRRQSAYDKDHNG